MRTMIGKRIGPVPIALVAVLALAAFISAGLWLTPTNGAQADSHPQAKITDGRTADPLVGMTSFSGDGMTIAKDGTIYLDYGDGTDGEAISVVVSNFGGTYDSPAVTTAAAAWDEPSQNTGTPPALPATTGVAYDNDDDTLTFVFPGMTTAALPEYNHDGDGATADVPVSGTATVTITVDQVTGTDADADPPNLAPETFTFKVKFEQNPIEVAGVMVRNPADLSGPEAAYPLGSGACEVLLADDGAAGTANGLLSSRTGAPATGNTDPRAFALAAGTNLISGGSCTTDGDSVNVKVKNADADDANFFIYVTGGDDFKKVMPQLGEGGLTEHVPFTVDGQPAAIPGQDPMPGEKTIPIARTKEGSAEHVYVIGYHGTTGYVGGNNLGDDSTTFGGDATFVIDVLFRGDPDKGMSDLMIGAINKDGESMVTVTVKDKAGNPLPGQHVDFSIEVAEDSDVKIAASGRANRREQTDAMGMASVTVEGLDPDGAVKLMVTAMVGDTLIGEENIIREDDPASIMLGNTAKGSLVEGDMFYVAARADDAAGNNVTDDVEDWAFDGGDDLTVAEDATMADMAWWDGLDCPQMVAIVSDSREANKDNPYCKMYADLGSAEMDVVMNLEVRQVTVKEDAAAGEHTVTVTADEDDSLMASTMVTVAGAPATWEFTTGPDRISTNDSAMYTVTAMDSDGGVPMTDMCVTIKLRAEEANDEQDISVAADNRSTMAGCTDSNQGMLDDDGTITFTVYAPVGVSANSAGRIVVEFDSAIVAQQSVTFAGRGPVGPTNAAPRAVGSIADMMLYVGGSTTVNAGFADADGDTLGYSASSSDTAVATATSNGGGSVTVNAVSMGEATITITASDGQLEATQSFMVSVMEVPDTTLGDVSGLMATAGDSMVTLTWDDAANADVYYIAGISQEDRAVRNYADVIFQEAMSGVELTGLTNGMAYDFTVIAGQTAEDGTRTWSAWHAIVSATPMEATSGPGNPFG